METAQFEEKQYEIGLLVELAAGSTSCFPSGQALEASLGYDFAISPGDPLIWTLLEIGCPPGILLTPSLWPASNRPPKGRLPSHLVSLIIQAKRPERLDHRRAGQNTYWKGPYFRFRLDPNQQSTLEKLEKAVAAEALVRYASAAFLEYRELLDHQSARTLSKHSSFVSPGLLAGHRLWTYAGPGNRGFANPDGHPVDADSVQTLLVTLRELAAPRSLSAHLQDLAEAVSGLAEPEAMAQKEWLIVMQERLDLPGPAVGSIAAWVEFASVVAMTGAMWLIFGFND